MFVYYIHKVYIINEIQKMKKNLSLVIGFSIVFQIFCPFRLLGQQSKKNTLYLCIYGKNWGYQVYKQNKSCYLVWLFKKIVGKKLTLSCRLWDF